MPAVLRSRAARPVIVSAATAALALGLGACGNNNNPVAGAASSASSAVVGSSGVGATPSPEVSFSSLTGISTIVTLDQDTAQVLSENGVTVVPVAGASAGQTTQGTTRVNFPITSGRLSVFPRSVSPFIQGEIDHSGGLAFRANGKELIATDFVVDPGESLLTATVNGMSVPLLFLDGTNVQVTMTNGNVMLSGTVAKLTEQAAQALNNTFSTQVFKAGTPLGTVQLTATDNPVTTPTAFLPNSSPDLVGSNVPTPGEGTSISPAPSDTLFPPPTPLPASS